MQAAQVFPIDPQNYPFGVTPEPGYVYGYIWGACPGCKEAGYIQPGHFACHLTPIPDGWEAITAPILTDSGWVVLVRRPVPEWSCPPVCPYCGQVGTSARSVPDDVWPLLEERVEEEDWEWGCVCPTCLVSLCTMCA